MPVDWQNDPIFDQISWLDDNYRSLEDRTWRGGGWYDVRGSGTCEDFCLWDNVTYSDVLPRPSDSTLISGGGFWSCSLDLGDTWTDPGQQGEKFEVLMCAGGREEVLSTEWGDRLSTPMFWSFVLPVCLAVFILEVWWYLVTTRKTQVDAAKASGDKVVVEGGRDIELAGDEEAVRLSLVSEEDTVSGRCHRCKVFLKGLVFTATVGGVAVSSLSLAESLGVVIPGPVLTRLTPACSANKCLKEAESFTRELQQANAPELFTVAIMSDPQLRWFNGELSFLGEDVPRMCEKGDGYKSCTKKIAEVTNREQMESIRQAGADTVFVNGDLTSYFHAHEFGQYKKWFHDNLPPNVQHFFPSLGNHDYDSGNDTLYNLDEWSFLGPGGCNNLHGAEYLRDGVGCNGIPKFDSSSLASFDLGSLAYSHSRGLYHFVHVHFHPEYENAKANIHSSQTWLLSEVKRANDENMRVVLVVHSATSISSDLERGLEDAGGLFMVFAGHLHHCLGGKCKYPVKRSSGVKCNKGFEEEFSTNCGKGCSDYGGTMAMYYATEGGQEVYDDDLDYDGQRCLPSSAGMGGLLDIAGGRVIWSGSSTYQTYLKADFSVGGVQVEVVSSVNGQVGSVDMNDAFSRRKYPYHYPEDLLLEIS